ncbi:DUF1392 domain-containing protein [Komarekiella sp. 'clone 1']|uniref:DUF1392 domain-containing protein n=1 Tax=Komarekiella delphini-convector SJRDD-AB1 TaxID=2593771 RepID=A0AA40T3I6_9NOST|nr:DUF1392 family protein [Komarekiella delphini-convector]MBD6620283.1 DUF1392 domain-containing protein [Komarekiella delphini-convector SJRDD-AB1]
MSSSKQKINGSNAKSGLTQKSSSLRLTTKEFKKGERVMLRSHDQVTKQRLVLGIQLINESWFYFVEWMPPALEECTSLDNRLALVQEKDLVRVVFNSKQ